MAIHLLSPQEAQKIAAGEVIERPAHIIKELIENSIDAGATIIEVTIHEGGKSHIQITDNGIGMTKEDAYLCIKRHTTSKLSTFDELETINTFGFRGEALASICSVANVTLTTKQKECFEGLQLSVTEGIINSEKTVSCQTGTTITVNDLFVTIPVRKKFLKTVTTEWNQILTLFKAFCFSCPNIHFSLTHNNTSVLLCPPVKTIKERCDQIFEKNISEATLMLEPYSEKNITISGCITKQTYSRYDRSHLYFFVNNRLVKNYQLTRAVLRGYENILPAQHYPVAILSLAIDPHEVDVNIHPKKEEVLFLHPHLVEQAITTAVKKTVVSHTTTTIAQTSYPSFKQSNEQRYQRHASFVFPQRSPVAFAKTQSTMQSKLSPKFFESNDQISQTITTTTTIQAEKKYHIIGQFLNTYILLEHPEGLLLIDQHASHERILYEQFRNHFHKQETIPLLFPHLVTLSKSDLELLEKHTLLLKAHGIITEPFGNEQIRITAVPVYAKQINFSELIQDLLRWIFEEKTTPEEQVFKKITEKLHAQLACKAAVKAGDMLTMEKMQELITTLEKTSNHHACPHGRPTQWLLETYEIEKKFKRII